MKLWYFTLPALIGLLLVFWIPTSMCCNKALCASDVSKCLIQSNIVRVWDCGIQHINGTAVFSKLHGCAPRTEAMCIFTVGAPEPDDEIILECSGAGTTKQQQGFTHLPSKTGENSMLTELCQCRPGEGNCSCCKECMLCLGTLWDECCDCVGMCNPRNYSDTPPTSKSTVEELHESIPSLFQALTEGDTQLNWNIVSFPVAEELSHHENLVSILETMNQPQNHNISVPNNNIHTSYSSEKERMCTVVYFDDCLSIHQCKQSCESMGASKYRWFHNACCECIGPECIDYGSKTVRCMNCMI